MKLVIAALLSLALSSSLRAATPEQLGTYIGNVSFTVYTFSSGTSQKFNLPLTLKINNDFSYEFVLPSRTWTGTYELGPVHGLLYSTANSEIFHAAIHFKNGSIKGELQESVIDPTTYVRVGKFKVKKLGQ